LIGLIVRSYAPTLFSQLGSFRIHPTSKLAGILRQSNNTGSAEPASVALFEENDSDSEGKVPSVSEDASLRADVETSIEDFVARLFGYSTLPKYALQALTNPMWHDKNTQDDALPSPHEAFQQTPVFRQWLLDDVFPWSKNEADKPQLKKFLAGINKGYDRFQGFRAAHSAPPGERFSDLSIPDGGFPIADQEWLRDLENSQSIISAEG
jgi:hypothetical protein